MVETPTIETIIIIATFVNIIISFLYFNMLLLLY